MTVDHHLLQRLAADQGGVLSTEQAAICGVSLRMVSRRTTTGAWRRVLPGVVTPGPAPDDVGRVHAAMLWAGAGSVLSGPSALWWWGLIEQAPEQVSVAVPVEKPRHPTGFVQVSRHRVLDADRVTLRGIRVVTKAYAVLFAGRHLDRSSAQALLDRALLREFRLRELEQVLSRYDGCAGTVGARRLLSAASDGTAAGSERMLAGLLRKAGITGWTVNRRRSVGGRRYIPDFTFERERLIIEVDGWAHHSDPDRFTRDRQRQNSFVLSGWRVLRFSWFQLTQQPEQVIATILQALAAR